MKIFLVPLLCLLLSFSALGQDQSGRSYVKKDSKVDQLLDAYRKNNRNRGMQGYRVQIYSASGNRSKLLTDREKASFDEAYPGIRSYITYDEPYYKLRVGDFRTRLDAERFMRQISSQYIYSMVVTDRIRLPQLSPDENDPVEAEQ